MTKRLAVIGALVFSLGVLACSKSSDPSNPTGSGGTLSVAGAVGSGGAVGLGGAVGTGGQSSAGGQAGSTTLQGECDIATRTGRFSVESQTDFGVVQGKVADGVVPTSVPQPISEGGGCKVFQRRNLTCVPACVGATTCAENGTCIAYPRQISVGNVTITGLTQATVMTPQTPGNSYFAPGADNPPFAPGSKVVLTADGADGRPGFRLSGVGSAPLGGKPTWTIERGKDLKVEWPKGDTAETKVTVELTIDQHGISPLSLSCEFPDTGSATVPSTTIDKLIDSGVSGYPNGRIFRRTADRITTDLGCIDFLVGAPLPASVSVVGYVPCKKSSDCPVGQTCDTAVELCK
jgi:hypothetical protein